MACFECGRRSMLINKFVPWVMVGIFIASLELFSLIIKHTPREYKHIWLL